MPGRGRLGGGHGSQCRGVEGTGRLGGDGDEIADLADCASAPGAVEYDAGGSEDLGVGVGDGDGPTDDVEGLEIVDVVADVGHAGRVEAVGLDPGAEDVRLAVDALCDVDVQLLRAAGHDRVALLGQDHHRHPGPHEAGDAHAVAAVDADLLVAVLVDIGSVVGVDAVEGGDPGVHVDVRDTDVGVLGTARQG